MYGLVTTDKRTCAFYYACLCEQVKQPMQFLGLYTPQPQLRPATGVLFSFWFMLQSESVCVSVGPQYVVDVHMLKMLCTGDNRA